MTNVVVRYNGRKFLFPTMEEDNEKAVRELKKQMEFSERILMYSCYLDCEVASRAITVCMEEFFCRPDIYRHKIKKLANEARKALYDTIQDILGHGDAEFLDNYSANFCEDLMPDIEKLRFAIEHEMNRAKIKEARLYSYVNTAFVMLQYCLRSYDKLMKELREKFGRDFSPLYVIFKPTKACALWDAMYGELFTRDKQDYEIDLNSSDMCRIAVDVIDHKLLNSDRIHDNIVRAYRELPDEKKTDEINRMLDEQGS